MEKPAIEHRVERLAQLGQVECVKLDELHRQLPLGCLPLGKLDRTDGYVHSDGVVAKRCGQQSMLASATSNAEHGPDKPPGRGEPLKCSLRPSDVPRRAG